MLNYEYPPLGGGAGLVCKNLATTLGELGVRIDIVTMHMKGLRREESSGNVRVFRVPSISRRVDICDFSEMTSFIPNALYKSIKLAKQEKYALNHTHFIIPTGIISLFLEKISKLPYVISVHGSDVPGYNPDRFTQLHVYVKDLWKEIILNSSMVIPLSERLKKMIEKNLKPPFVQIVPNALPVNKFKPKQKKKQILVVSRLLPRKGIQFLLKAVSTLAIDLHVHIVGDGPYRRNLEDAAEYENLDITFHGWLDNSSKELAELYQTSEFFVLPSESENFPIVLLEAMAAGSTIITTDKSGCEFVVGKTGLLVPPRNPEAISSSLQKLLDNPSLSQELGIRARERFEKRFTWSKVAKQYLEVYNSVLSRRGSIS